MLTFIRFQNVVVTTKVAEVVIHNTYTVVKVVEKSGHPLIASDADVFISSPWNIIELAKTN